MTVRDLGTDLVKVRVGTDLVTVRDLGTDLVTVTDLVMVWADLVRVGMGPELWTDFGADLELLLANSPHLGRLTMDKKS